MAEKVSFLKLPVEIHIQRLLDDFGSVPESLWCPSYWPVTHDAVEIILLRGGTTGTEEDFCTTDVSDHSILDALPYFRLLMSTHGPLGRSFFAFLLRMPSRGVTRLHWDGKPIWKNLYRVHVPIETNREALLVVEGQRGQHFRMGEAWTFDNQALHGVINGEGRRTHLILDVPDSNEKMSAARRKAQVIAGEPVPDSEWRKVSSTSPLDERSEKAYQSLLRMINGYYYSWMVNVAARLRLADRLSAEPTSLPELAGACGVDPSSLERLMEALQVVDLVAIDGNGRYISTPVLEWLRSDAVGGLRDMALISGERCFWEAWEGLYEAVRSGHSAFEAVHKKHIFEYLDVHLEVLTRFQRAFKGNPGWNAAMVLSYDFSRHQKLVDVGGGHGALADAIVEIHPHIEAIVFDRPAVERTRDMEPGDRFQWIKGDFLHDVPAGADAYVLRFVLHDWDDDSAIAILSNCRRAMANDGRVLVFELLRTPGQKSQAALLDLTMMVLTGGQERTDAQYRDLLHRAGLEAVAVHETPVGVSIIEARRR